jgi:NAD(P)H-flavin reductase
VKSPPISHIDQLESFILIIQICKASQHQLPGKMSDCIDRLQEGDFILCKEPFGDFQYLGNKTFSNKGIILQVDQLTMIAAGTEMTPIYQVFRYMHTTMELNVILFIVIKQKMIFFYEMNLNISNKLIIVFQVQMR